MRAITICQPYAHLIAAGDKLVENRTWPTNYRGRLAIHAGKSRAWLEPGDLEILPGMVFGAVVATVDLIECLHVRSIFADWDGGGFYSGHHPNLPPHLHWLVEHEHTEGPWCFVLADVQKIEPVPWKGQQGFFDIPNFSRNRP